MTGKDKYKFYVSVVGVFRLVKLVIPVIISGSREGKVYDFRRKTGAWKFIRYENPYLYDELVLAIHNVSTAANKILVKIELWDDWNTYTSTEFEGYVPLKNLEINEDDGVIQFTPIEQGKYTWYDEHKQEKHDIYNELSSYSPAKYDITTEFEEYYIGSGTDHILPSGFLATIGATLQSYSQSVNYGNVGLYDYANWVRHTGANGSRAYRCIVMNGPASEIIIPGVTPGWEDYWEQNNIVQHIYRQVCDLPFFTGTPRRDYIHGNGLFEAGFPGDVTENDTNCTNLKENRYSYPWDTIETGTMNLAGVLEIQGINVGDVSSAGPCHPLYDTTGPNASGTNSVLDHLLFGSGLIVHSHFFEDAINPVTGEANTLTNLKLSHVEAIRRVYRYETKGEVTLEQVLNDLCEMFNLNWMISGTNLIIEHISYFENGFSYTPNPVIYADLTGFPVKYQTIYDCALNGTDNNYTFAESETQEKDIFHFPAGYDYDGEIKYFSDYAKKGEVMRHEISTMVGDFANFIYFPNMEAGGYFCLLALDGNDKIYRRATGMRWVPGNQYFAKVYRLVETSFPNGDMLWDNLLNDFWVYSLPYTKGQINGEYPDTTFITAKRIKKQGKVQIPRFTGAFTPEGLVTTNIGTGKIFSFEYNTDTDFITLILTYVA